MDATCIDQRAVPCCAVLPSAVLNRDNMVGLLYIHDPKCSPEQHSDEARQLREAFDRQYSMTVFQLKEQGGVQGDLLTTGDSSKEQGGVQGDMLTTGTGSSGSDRVGGSSGAGGSGSDAAGLGGGNAGVQERGAGMGQAEEEGSDVVRDTDQQQACKKRRTAGTGGGVDKEDGPRLLTFEEYLQQRAGKKKISVSAV